MKRIDVVKKGERWIGQSGGRQVAAAPTKAEAVRKIARVAKADPQPVTVKIHKQNGRIQEERTYPGRADPRRSKGQARRPLALPDSCTASNRRPRYPRSATTSFPLVGLPASVSIQSINRLVYCSSPI